MSEGAVRDLQDPYAIVDPVVKPWAERRRIRITSKYRDDYVRSILILDRTGKARAQMWLDLPKVDGVVKVILLSLDPTRPSECVQREERVADLHTLEAVLDELTSIAFGWAGPGAVTV